VPDLYASSVAVDLSRLPAPPVVASLSFETRLAAIVADFQARCTAAGVDYDLIVESDPAMKLLEELAYRDMLSTAEINDAARSMMLAFAKGGDLDHLAAFFGVQRLVITPATDDAPAVMERDEDLRIRVQIAPETFPALGRTAGGYRGLVLAAAPSVKDVALVKRDGGRVDVILLGRDGAGDVPDAIVQAVYVALQPDDATQLTDIVTVGAASIIAYSPTITLKIRNGPDPQIVATAAERAVRAYAADRHRIGLPVYAQMLTAAATSVGSVERAEIDIGDIVVSPREAPWLSGLSILVEIV